MLKSLYFAALYLYSKGSRPKLLASQRTVVSAVKANPVGFYE
jgi:hypothetical protein